MYAVCRQSKFEWINDKYTVHIHSHTRAYVYINTHVPIFLRTNHNHIYNHYHLQYLVILSKIYIMHHASYDYIQYYAYIYIIYNWCTMITILYIFLFFCSCMLSFFTPRFHHDKGTDSWHLRAPPDVERPVMHPHNILTFSDKRRRISNWRYLFMTK